ncbi:MAG TPA: 3-ketoacyl-ACP reductase [Clostridiaceae bacterium]|nr:3-ketoacyl-ACP reductase [Clostridiaceae bacterium]
MHKRGCFFTFINFKIRRYEILKTNKVALITGAARGIGNGIAVKLAEDGYNIAMVATRNEEEVAESIAKVREKAGENKVIYIKGDISSSESRENIINTTMKEFGRIDVLVNNAGVAPKVRMDILETTEESMDYVLNINLKGTFFLTQLVANTMIKLKSILNDDSYKPKIINISSISAYVSSTNRGEYCISKAGISMITSLFADRLSEYGINVYEIRPGIIQTDMTAKVKEKYDKLISEGITPIKRWGYPEDVAKVVSVICSGNLDFSTGEVINVDGGFHLRRL